MRPSVRRRQKCQNQARLLTRPRRSRILITLRCSRGTQKVGTDMTQSLLARSAGPLAIVAGALVGRHPRGDHGDDPRRHRLAQGLRPPTTHAINSVASIVAFAMLVFALVASYDLQARACWGARPDRTRRSHPGHRVHGRRLVVRGVRRTEARGSRPRGDGHVCAQPTAPRRPDELRAVRDRLGALRDRQRSRSCLPRRRSRGRSSQAACCPGSPSASSTFPGASSSGWPSSRSGRGGCVQATHEIFAIHARRPSPARRV